MQIYLIAFLLYFQSFASSKPAPDVCSQHAEDTQTVNLIFQSADGGKTWQDVSAGLPANLQTEAFFAGDAGLYIGAVNGVYRGSIATQTPDWEKEVLPDDRGITWKYVQEQSWRIDEVESEGVLLRTDQQGILRSTDGGEHWEVVISEGGVGIAVERIAGGFAAITYNTRSETRRVRTSFDGGKTWQPIDAGLRPSELIASIKQVGEYFFCGHPDGIFRSSDRGKTWERMLPSVGDKVFNLSVWGNVVYAVPRNGGC